MPTHILTLLADYAGLVRVTDLSPEGTVCHVVSALPQAFHQVACNSYPDLASARFQYFVETVRPCIVSWTGAPYHVILQVLPRLRTALMEQTCVFVPSYFDFIRLRNYTKREDVTCAQMCE